MSESTDTVATPSEGDSISEILDHLPPEVAQALGKSKSVDSPDPEAEVIDSDADENQESQDNSNEESSDEETTEETDEEAKPKSVEKLEKRIDKLTRKRREAETAAEQLRAENETLKAEVEKRNAIKLEPTPEDPLADIESAEELDAKVSAAKKVRAWALANPDGATITNPDGSERYVDRSEVAKYLAQTDALLTDHAPTRREYLREREAILVESKMTYPDLFKAGTPSHKVMIDTLKKVPALKRLPNYEMIIGDAMAGMSARLAAAVKNADVTSKKPNQASSRKIAPAVPKPTASRPPSTTGKSKNASLDRVIAGGSIDDLANYFAAA